MVACSRTAVIGINLNPQTGQRRDMIGRLNHVAVAVPNVLEAAQRYRDVFGAEVSTPTPQPEHGVTTVFVTLANTKLELLEPLGRRFADRALS